MWGTQARARAVGKEANDALAVCRHRARATQTSVHVPYYWVAALTVQ